MLGFWIRVVLIAVAAYFCGCFNGAVIVSKYILRDDVRTHGSGNAGLTNFYRTYGARYALCVIVCDMGKTVLACLIGGYLMHWVVGDWTLGLLIAGIGCELGHMFPVFFGLRGGKGILSGGTIAIMIDWRIALVVWGGFLILAVLTRYVSLGSCWAGASFPFITWFVYRSVPVTVLAVIIGGLILYMHRGNIHRLLTGTENKFTLHKKS